MLDNGQTLIHGDNHRSPICAIIVITTVIITIIIIGLIRVVEIAAFTAIIIAVLVLAAIIVAIIKIDDEAALQILLAHRPSRMTQFITSPNSVTDSKRSLGMVSGVIAA
ncbi:hypothetical protein BDZ45DRAFT_746372 [Acephala macrosclerotiorum]|nr:hypothetical protein BDZ45DRAFT_746372 [Acephala macrosclerotiorum]